MPKDPVTFDRPDNDSIEIIRDAAGRIIAAQRHDHSILTYLLKCNLADHGHEASATTYLDWQLAYTSTRGMKVANYGQHDGGDGGSEKASKYLRLIRKLGLETQRKVEACIEAEGVQTSYPTEQLPKLYSQLKGKDFALAKQAARFLEMIFRPSVAVLDKLGRAIHEVKEEFKAEEQAELSGDDKNSLAPVNEMG